MHLEGISKKGMKKQKRGKTEMTTVKMEQKETKTKLPAVSTIKSETLLIGESSLKLQEVGTKADESKMKTSSADGCVNKVDMEWHESNVSVALDQLKSGLLQDEQLHTLVQKSPLRYVDACSTSSYNQK